MPEVPSMDVMYTTTYRLNSRTHEIIKPRNLLKSPTHGARHGVCACDLRTWEVKPKGSEFKDFLNYVGNSRPAWPMSDTRAKLKNCLTKITRHYLR